MSGGEPLRRPTAAHIDGSHSVSIRRKKSNRYARAGMNEPGSDKRGRAALGANGSSNKNLCVSEHTNVILV
jgi:hypothetical protein